MEQPKIERVLRLMKMMTGNNNYTVEDMAERLGTSYRSVYRYIETFKDAGFVVQRKDGGIYKLGKDSRYFKEISQLIHFTDEEAHIVNQLIEGLDNTNMIKQNLRKKLTAVYNCTSLADSVVDGKNAINVNRIIEAITNRKQTILRSYASSHTGVVRDRLVEPLRQTMCRCGATNPNRDSTNSSTPPASAQSKYSIQIGNSTNGITRVISIFSALRASSRSAC